MRGLLLILLLLAAPLRAEEVVLGLSRDQVSISTNFDGSEVIIYGAIKREVPIPEGEPLQVIVTISGPLWTSFSTSRRILRRSTSRFFRTFAATPLPSLTKPSRMCSVPMYSWLNR